MSDERLERAAALSLRQRAMPWLWLGLAVVSLAVGVITGYSDPAITIGALILGRLAQMDNAAYQRARVFAVQTDWIARRLNERPHE